MDSNEAKDFLVGQTVQQAALEAIPFSDVEKRMMYFTETDPSSCANPISLNDEFEAECETEEYEEKVSLLLQHAYARLKSESKEAVAQWDEAIRTLRRGDHYLLVLWDTKQK